MLWFWSFALLDSVYFTHIDYVIYANARSCPEGKEKTRKHKSQFLRSGWKHRREA